MKQSVADEAVSLAMNGCWEEAVAVNQSIIERSPDDVEAHNRLGKALSELGQYAEARQSYERTLELDPTNSIAKKNIQRLAVLESDGGSMNDPHVIDSRFFIEETGKARVITLYRVAPKSSLVKMSAGDVVRLQSQDQALFVLTGDGEYLGEIEPKIASRLIELMEGGNQYEAAIIGLMDDRVKVIIREAYQHPNLAGHLSFPPRVVDEPRPYLKDTLVKYDIDEDIPEEPDEPGDLEGEVEPDWEEEEDIDGEELDESD